MQFFSDQIDAKIAKATREGRRREFAAFAQFGEEIPDPQAEEAFERSKLSWEGDRAIEVLYQGLMLVRRELPRGDADAIEYDENAKWLRVRRGEFELVCNFSHDEAQVPVSAGDVVIATHSGRIDEGRITLQPLAGALLR